MLTNDERKALKNVKIMISEKYRLIVLILYGSKASGKDTEESDIDVMVELEEDSRDVRWDIYKMIADVNVNFGCVISPVLFSRKELEDGPILSLQALQAHCKRRNQNITMETDHVEKRFFSWMISQKN